MYKLDFINFKAIHIPDVGKDIVYHYDDGYSSSTVQETRITANGSLEVWLGNIVVKKEYYQMAMDTGIYWNQYVNDETQKKFPAEWLMKEWYPGSMVSYKGNERFERSLTTRELIDYIQSTRTE